MNDQQRAAMIRPRGKSEAPHMIAAYRAMQMALKTIEALVGWMDARQLVVLGNERETITALREALAQPQKSRYSSLDFAKAQQEYLAQPQGEHKTDGSPCWCNPEVTYENPETGVKVIVHKEPQGEWVDLTDDEIHAAINEPTEDLEVMMWRANYCRAVIAAFKEKNK